MNKDDPGKCDRQAPIVCFDFGDLRLAITSTLVSIIGVNLNVLEVLWVINHIQHESVSDVSRGTMSAENIGRRT